MSESTEAFRSLDQIERQLLERLLGVDFPGRDELREQVKHAVVREIDEHGCLEFHVDYDVLAEVQHTVPVEAEAQDSDGIGIELLLFVKRGKISDLELNKGDGSPIVDMPKPERWEVRAN